MNAGSFHQPAAVLPSGRTCQIQGTQQKTSHGEIASSLTTLGLLLPIWYFRKCSQSAGVLQKYSSCLERWQAGWLDTKSAFGHAGETPNPINCRVPGHLGGVGNFYQFLSLLPAHRFTAGQYIFQPVYPHFVHCADSSGAGLYVLKQTLCQLSEVFPTEDGDPALSCGCLGRGGQHILKPLLFEMNFYNWGNDGLPSPARGEHWPLLLQTCPTNHSPARVREVSDPWSYFSFWNFICYSNLCKRNPFLIVSVMCMEVVSGGCLFAYTNTS